MKNYFQAPWTIKQLIRTFLMLILLGGLTIAGAHYFFRTIDYDKNSTSIVALGFLVQWVIIISSFFTFAPKNFFNPKAWLLKNIGLLKTLKVVLKNYLLYFGIIFSILIFMSTTGMKIPGFEQQESIFEILNSSNASLFILGIMIVLIAPILEELFFRGFVLQSLVDKIGTKWGSVVTAGIFAIFHLEPQAFFPLFIIGLIINNIAIKHKSIIPTIAYHMMNNGIAFALQILIVKNLL
ncbi:MAG: CPBP family intramembrane metalloprotease [Lutibacter sp.]|nr:CPBP family intramembrane metalloprotease [Lutibacter sp.]